jgi:hypothetical protein
MNLPGMVVTMRRAAEDREARAICPSPRLLFFAIDIADDLPYNPPDQALLPAI